MPKQLTAQTATITTASVEVKTLTISGKQVTLAVYRQLIEEPLINHDGQLLGQPWGNVNRCPETKYWNADGYAMKDCATSPTHLHTVWQKGQELRRARVEVPAWGAPMYFEWGDAFAQGAYCTNGHQLPDWMRSIYRDGDHEVTFQYDGLRCSSGYPDYRPGHECLDAAEFKKAKKELSAEATAESEQRERHRTQWRALSSLPQLFIAV